ncbi:polymer-forming cytoskeletal protein [Shouchella clausii]|uniref:polymer-forming cytoskeletal protein n=1 Tax=Shouchella clausii TaxID=79880 RepID=UPI0021761987|nr:polymer-forming cytoskeletal protein [Shouchella clausii]
MRRSAFWLIQLLCIPLHISVWLTTDWVELTHIHYLYLGGAIFLATLAIYAIYLRLDVWRLEKKLHKKGESAMNKIIINGKSISVSGNNISVINGKIYTDGTLVESGLSGQVTILFEGDLANLKTDGSATIQGNVKGNVDAGGSVTCGNVGQSIDAGGSVKCGTVGGDVDAGGSVSMKR